MTLRQAIASAQAVSPMVLEKAKSPAGVVADVLTRALLDAERHANGVDMDIDWSTLRVETDFERAFEALRFRVRVEAEPRPVTTVDVFKAVALSLHEAKKRRDV